MKGFTLIEVLISTLILTMLFLGVFQIMDVSRKSWFTGDAVVELRANVVQAFMQMEMELKETRPAQISLGAGDASSSLTFRLPEDSNGDGTILNTSGNVEWGSNIIYTLNGQNQITRTTTSGVSVLAHNISNLKFTRPLSPLNILQVDISLQKTTDTGRIIQDMDQLKVKMRN